MTSLAAHQVLRHGIARSFQNVELIKELSVLENVLIGAHIACKTSLGAEIFNLRSRRQEENEMTKAALGMLDFLGIAATTYSPAGAQPYGVQKKVELARALISRPSLLILDEPAAGLTEQESAEFALLLSAIKRELACTILLVEHDMGLVMQVCDRICAISFGKLLAVGSPAAIRADIRVQEAYLGEEA